MTTYYVDITKDEFETWLDTFDIPWKLKKGTAGCYLLRVGDAVALHITSTLGTEASKGYAKAAAQMRLVSLPEGKRCLNKKAQGQKHFKRTKGWRTQWAKGVARMIAAYEKAPGFYEEKALEAEPMEEPDPRETQLNRLRRLWKETKGAGDEWASNFVASVGSQYKEGRELSQRQAKVISELFTKYPIQEVS